MQPKISKTEPKISKTKPKELWQIIANQEAYRMKKIKPKPRHRKAKI